jgi:epoxyqueuosine reductase
MASLLELFAWNEAEFLERLAGSPIRRIGHVRWLRNIALALGNLPATAPQREAAIAALSAQADHPDATVREQVAWSLAQLTGQT